MPSNPLKHPVRHQRSTLGVGWKPDGHAAFVGPGTKWANPFKKPDVEALRGEPDIEKAYQQGGWREAANLLYREHLQDEGHLVNRDIWPMLLLRVGSGAEFEHRDYAVDRVRGCACLT